MVPFILLVLEITAMLAALVTYLIPVACPYQAAASRVW